MLGIWVYSEADNFEYTSLLLQKFYEKFYEQHSEGTASVQCDWLHFLQHKVRTSHRQRNCSRNKLLSVEVI